MHTDEAVHAIKFGPLLERGVYRYDRQEYHGPTLNYLTLIPAWLSSATQLTEISETTLRIVPVFFGVLLVALLLLAGDGLGWPAVAVSALLTAISPAMVYYSRYYIMELLLVCFTFGVMLSGYRYVRSRKIGWALSTGIFLGLMHATKETFVLALIAMLAALWLTLMLGRRRGGRGPLEVIKTIAPGHALALVGAGLLVSALFYSSFLSHPQGVLDSIYAYKSYFVRAGQNQLHLHPWYYYLKMIIYSRYFGGPIWSEGLIVFLAVIGFGVAMTRRGLEGTPVGLLRFIAFYTLILTVIYALIPYKTPWNLLGFLHGMILLAGVGAVRVIHWRPQLVPRVLIMLLLALGSVQLAGQAYRASYVYAADPANPYVYAHPVPDVLTVAQRVAEVARSHPDGERLFIEVIFPEDDYWPLPWYLRAFPNIGWWSAVDEQVPPASIILAAPAVEQALMHKFYNLPPPGERNLYLPLFDTYLEMRPQVEVRGYVTKELWDAYQQREIPPEPSTTRQP